MIAKNHKANDYMHDLDLMYTLHYLTLIGCFLSYEEWGQREIYPNNTSLP